jgi:polar amino acid transport system substrate-binding protein
VVELDSMPHVERESIPLVVALQRFPRRFTSSHEDASFRRVKLTQTMGIIWALVLSSACASTSPANAESAAAPAAQAARSSVLHRVAESGVIRVGLSGDQPPFNMKDENGELMGIDIDIVNAMAMAIGAEAEFVEMPFKDLIPALEEHEVDMVLSGMTITPRRNMRVAFAGPYSVAGKSILTNSDELSEASTLQDLDQPEMKLGVLAGSTSEAFARRAFPRATVETADSYADAIQMILEGEVAAVVADRPILVVTMMKNPDVNLMISNAPLTVEPIGVALPAGDPLLLNFIDNTLGAMDAVGLIDAIESRWLDDANWIDRLP